jgi:hypothetical protein
LANVGVWNHQFAFNPTGAINPAQVVEVCGDLAHPTWTPLQTNTLSGDSFNFSDPQWTNFPVRFYPVRSPEARVRRAGIGRDDEAYEKI